jgi:adenosylcobinamide-phosphate guanylyltransferase
VGVVALVMAGGKATRMNSAVEKPLLEVGGKSMIQRVVEALSRSEAVERIIIAVTEDTPQTTRKASELKCEVVFTPGGGYRSDMKYAIKERHLNDALVVSADLPFINAEIVNRAVRVYRSSGKPALAVMTLLETYRKLGSNAPYIFEIERRSLVPIGINIVDGSRIDEPELEEEILLAELEELAMNVNTPQDLELARQRHKQERTIPIEGRPR